MTDALAAARQARAALVAVATVEHIGYGRREWAR